MVLSAILESTGKRVKASDCDWGTSEHFGQLIHPFIPEAKVTPVRTHLRGGSLVTAHFRCIGNPAVDAEFAQENEEYFVRGGVTASESLEHIAGKEYVADNASYIFSQCKSEHSEFELRLSDVGLHGRIADVAFRLADGRLFIHEVQLASITANELDQRTSDYQKAGHDVCWWLGGAAHTQPNVQFLKNRLSFLPPVLTYRTEEARHAA